MATSLARAVTGLSEKEVQHIFHALKREATGMPAPSELQITEWRARQYELLSRCKRMSDTRMDKMRDRLFRSRGESVPDGPTFHAWATVEARARQEVALRSIGTAVDLDPPGSQAHLYDLGEDGRPKRVWYASYGSNLHRDRFMNYIKGGSPEGTTRTYAGCTDKTEPEGDIPIRFAGARPHFALTSRVWNGGIAFIDSQKGESAHGLGRAYDISISQFDEVVAQENGSPTSAAVAIPLDEALATGRSSIGNGSYETILHIGDYQGAPVLTFTAPFSTREALTGTGHITRTPVGSTTPVRMPVLTNKPSPAYLRMIGSGLEETFGMDEVAQADYLRGCPGGDRWTRQQMVRILRGQEPDAERAPGPENPRSKRAKAGAKNDTKTKGANPKGTKAKGADNASRALAGTSGKAAVFSHAKPTGNTSGSKGTAKAGDSKAAADIRRRNNRANGTGDIKPLPNVATYKSEEERQIGVARWSRIAREAEDLVTKHTTTVNSLRLARTQAAASGSPLSGIDRALSNAEVAVARSQAYADEARTKLRKARAQRPARYYNTDTARTLSEWMEEDNRVVTQQRHAETAVDAAKDTLRTLRTTPGTSEREIEQARETVEVTQAHLDTLNNRLQETHEIILSIKNRPALVSKNPNHKPATPKPTAPKPTSPTASKAAQTSKPGPNNTNQGKQTGKNHKKKPRNQRTPGQTSR